MVLSINEGFNQQEQGFNQLTSSTEHHGDIMGTGNHLMGIPHFQTDQIVWENPWENHPTMVAQEF